MTAFTAFWALLTKGLTIVWLIGMGAMMLFIIGHMLWQHITATRPPRGR